MNRLILKNMALLAVVLLLFTGCERNLDVDSSSAQSSSVDNRLKFEFVLDNNITVVMKDKKFHLEGSRFVLYNISAIWCEACVIVDAQLEDIGTRLEKDLSIVRLDVNASGDEEMLIAALLDSLDIDKKSYSVPLVLMFKDDKYVKKYDSLMPEMMLERDIKLELKL